MKFGCSLEMINLRTSGPNFIIKQSKAYWVEMFKLIAAAGFKGIELPYNPYSSDPVTFEIGRCGMPVSRFAVDKKYGSPKEFLDLLKNSGIEEVTSVHINANDIMLELLGTQQGCVQLPDMLEALAGEAMEFLVDVGGTGLVISPTPETGLLARQMGGEVSAWKKPYLDGIGQALNRIGKMAAAKGIRATLTNEFWSLVRGSEIEEFLRGLDGEYLGYSPDLAHLAIAQADPVKTIKKFDGRLDYVRFTDTAFVDREKNYQSGHAEIPITGAQRVFCDLGEGNVDVPGVHHTLKESSYDGWVICESRMTLNVYRALLKMRWYLDNVVLKA